MRYQVVKGMQDLLPPESEAWAAVEATARSLFSRFACREIRTPLVEEKHLFARTLGDATSVVEKEMYDFQDKKAKWLVLRPEATASTVRAFVESGEAANNSFARYFYIGPMYRYEQPQQGRYREFHQIGVEAFGCKSPLLDAEIIHMADQFFKALGLNDLALEINSLGCPLCRPKFVAVFLKFLEEKKSSLCADCHHRIAKNPYRVLDCKNENCIKVTIEAPSIQDHLCADCEGHFDEVLEALGALGSHYQVNPRIVRGLDYYMRTTFELTTKDLGAQNAVCGGGRYDGLVHLLGGPNLPGFGFALGLERLMELLKVKGLGKQNETDQKTIFVAPMGEEALKIGFKLAQNLRNSGLCVEMNLEGASLKSSLRRADRIQASHVVILGEDELKKKIVAIKNMKTGIQNEIPLSELSKESFT